MAGLKLSPHLFGQVKGRGADGMPKVHLHGEAVSAFYIVTQAIKNSKGGSHIPPFLYVGLTTATGAKYAHNPP